MVFIKTMVLTLVAALALNTNLNSGRMDFALGATGILGTANIYLLDAIDKIIKMRNEGKRDFVSGIDTIGNIFSFLFLTMIFSALLGLIHGIIFIILRLPPIVTSLGMCLVFEGIARVIAGSKGQINLASSQITSNFFLEPIIIIPILIIIMIVMSWAFCYTKFGYDKLALVYDQKISVDTGIKEVKNCIVCY